MTANLLSRPLGYDWQGHLCYFTDSLIKVDFVHTLLVDFAQKGIGWLATY